MVVQLERDIPTRAVVEIGKTAETIPYFCKQDAVEPIVIATHGPTGKSRWVLGGVTDKVLRAADRTIGFERAKTSMAGLEAR